MIVNSLTATKNTSDAWAEGIKKESINWNSETYADRAASASTTHRIERIESIIADPSGKIKLDPGMMRSNDETVKTLWAIRVLSPYRIFKQRSMDPADATAQSKRDEIIGSKEKADRVQAGWDPSRRDPQRSNINVECLWFYRFILLLRRCGEAFNIVSIESGHIRRCCLMKNRFIKKMTVDWVRFATAS